MLRLKVGACSNLWGTVVAYVCTQSEECTLLILASPRKSAAKALLSDRALLAGVFRQLAGVGGPQVY